MLYRAGLERCKLRRSCVLSSFARVKGGKKFWWLCDEAVYISIGALVGNKEGLLRMGNHCCSKKGLFFRDPSTTQDQEHEQRL